MKTIHLNTATGSTLIAVGEQLERLAHYARERRVVVLTDENVLRHYSADIVADDVIVTAGGENHKNLKAVHEIYDELLSLECDRSTLLVGIGGGIVTDIAGFVAATYMRGMGLGLIPTTLLAQVDAAIGGKNGVNLHGYKNMIGTFRQPEFVLICPSVLDTLSPARRSEGFAELIKHAFISDASLVDDVERDLDALMSLSDPARVEEILHRSVNIKAQIVTSDPTEADSRMLLNFGHTMGHALEKTTGLSHGQAVAVGMVTAARMSQRRGWLTDDEVARLIAILDRSGLPTRAPHVDPRTIIDALGKDKKRRQDTFHVVMLQGLGHAVVQAVTSAELNEWVDDLCQSRGAQP